MEIEVIGVDHIYVTVRHLERSQQSYDRAMKVLGFRKAVRPLAGGDLHVHYYNRSIQYTLRPAAEHTRDHDPYSPGLHHLCLRVADREAVDRAASDLQAAGIDATEPHDYPEYHPDYYATFFSDPDGIRLEVVNHLEMRKKLAEIWETLPAIGA